MTAYKSELVRPLRLAENHFLEVLVSKFDLRRHKNHLTLNISFDGETEATWNRAGREEVRSRNRVFSERARDYQKRLDALAFGSEKGRWRFNDPTFPFRWASAGALPILRMGKHDYYCLFYREIFPIGWNIANGACDNVSELLDPVSTLERELREELIVLDVANRYWYVLERGAYKSDRPDIAAVELILQKAKYKNKLGKAGQRIRKLTDLCQLETPLKWLEGPDSVRVNMDGKIREVTGCFLNMNASDFGIEVDRVAKLNVGESVALFDGELSRGKLLNRLVGLFRVDRFDFVKSEHIPDVFFYKGSRYSQADFKTLMRSRFIPDIRGNRTPEEITAYKASENPYDLCPVTRNIIRRYIGVSQQQKPGVAPVEVFVSFGRGDERLAGEVAHCIRDICGKRVFFSPESRYDQLWDRAIDDALDSAKCLVVVGTKLSRIQRRWPEYEYRTFHKDIKSGKKKKARLFSVVTGIDPVQMPLPLRSYAVETCNKGEEVKKLLAKLSKKLC